MVCTTIALAAAVLGTAFLLLPATEAAARAQVGPPDGRSEQQAEEMSRMRPIAATAYRRCGRIYGRVARHDAARHGIRWTSQPHRVENSSVLACGVRREGPRHVGPGE